MISRIVETQQDCDLLIRLIGSKPRPFTVAIRDGKHRTPPQNRLQHKWYQEAAEQLGEYDAGEYKNRCKLRFGVPILRATCDKFADMWEKSVEHLPHETKVEMMEFISVTRLMTTKEKTQYLDAVQKFLLERGADLTRPDG